MMILIHDKTCEFCLYILESSYLYTWVSISLEMKKCLLEFGRIFLVFNILAFFIFNILNVDVLTVLPKELINI